MNPIDVAAIVLFLLPVADWTAFVILYAYSHRSGVTALSERASVALILAICATGIGMLAAARLFGTRLDPDVTTTLLLVAMFGISLPSLNWLRVFMANGFRDGSDS